jgi:hypothetical protein
LLMNCVNFIRNLFHSLDFGARLQLEAGLKTD